jgi:hypothetical protein
MGYADFNFFGSGSSGLGGYAVSNFTSSEHDSPAIAIYIAQLSLGLLYLPTRSMWVIRIEELHGLDFIQEVKRRYGIALCGLFIDLENNTLMNVGDRQIMFRCSHSSDNPVSVELVQVSGTEPE